MNKKQNLLAIALSASFVLAGANVAEANEQVQTENVSQVIDNKAQADLPQGQASKNEAKSEEKSETADAKPLGMEISEEKTPKAQKAAAENSEPNYSEEEKNIKDYSDSERYKETDLTPGSTIVENGITDEGKEKDGFKFDTLNPSPTSPSKTEYGYLITIDKETGQRTYTKVIVSDSGLIPVNTGDKPMMGEGEKLTPDSPEVTYKPDEDGGISGRRQKLYNYEASEETLKHINSKDNSSTVIGMKDNYTQDNPQKKYFEESFLVTYKVNPWPNENDKLEQLKLNTEKLDPDAKYFVKGQDIDTGVKVDNIDDSAKERLVGQVYHPVTGKIVPGAKAYIGDDGNIHITMPKGAINEDGSINKDSIFSKDPSFRGIQSLDVRFFARPRTAEEFKTIAETPDDDGETGTYVETGAGTGVVNHKGTNVEIDKQGIDRYDHYNLVGNFKLNLDDTKYYDQKYKDQDDKPTKDNVFSEVEPGKAFEIKMESNFGKDKDKYDKTPKDMKGAQERNEATAKANLQFFLENNTDKDGKLKPEEDRWKLSIGGKEIDLTKREKEISVDDLSNLKITAPSTAKAGEFVAIPVEYTYTNGSKDIHWFHFVVKESDNNVPKYESEAGIAGKELKKTPELSQTDAAKKKLQPKSYKLAKTEYKDDKGNVWNVSIDETTGEVTATVPGNDKIPETGTKLNVDVEVTYEEEVEVGDKKETKTYTEKTRAQFYSIPSTKQEVKKEYETKLPFETKVIYDENIPAGKVIEEGGKVGKQKMVFSQIVVGNKKGAIIDGKFVEDSESVTTEVVEKAQDKIIRIGTKPTTEKVVIPRGLEYELDYTKTGGEPEVVEEGNDGEVTVTTKRDPKTGVITMEKTTTTEAKPKKIKIPAGTEGAHEYTEKKPFTYDIQFDPDFYKNYPDAKDNYKIVTEGKVGEKTTKWTIKNSKIGGEPKIIKDTDPTNAVIKVGQKDYTGTITHTESHEVPFEVEYKYSDELEAGQTRVEQKGEKGSYDVEYSQKIKNGEKDGELTSTKKNKKAAKKEIIVIGTKPVTKVVEKPFNTEYQYDKNLEVGKTEEVTPGKNGKVTITTTYDEAQKKVVSTETEEAGQNRVVKIGGKTNGEVKVKSEISYEVEIIEDETMDAGTHRVEQEGEKGEKETTIVIENSEEKSRTDKTIKEAKKKIIRVGTKPNPKMCPVPEKPKTSEEPEHPTPSPENPKNLEKPGEDKPNKPGTPGETPEEPGKPNEPGTPGERPNKPGKPGEPGKENPKTEERPKENSAKEESTREEKNNSGYDMLSRKRKDYQELSRKDKSTNPKTGIGSVAPILSSMGISIAGLLATRKKKEEDDE